MITRCWRYYSQRLRETVKYSPGGVLNALAAALRGGNPLTLSTHRLRRGLPGYLILFAPHAFAPQRQLQTSGEGALLGQN